MNYDWFFPVIDGQLREALRPDLGERTDEIVAAYRAERTFMPASLLFATIVTDRDWRLPSLRLAEAKMSRCQRRAAGLRTGQPQSCNDEYTELPHRVTMKTPDHCQKNWQFPTSALPDSLTNGKVPSVVVLKSIKAVVVKHGSSPFAWCSAVAA